MEADEDGRLLIEKKQDEFFLSLTDNQKKEIHDTVSEDLSRMKKEISEINQVLDIKEKLSSVLPIISVSYLAKNYFHRTPQWFYQRLNGNKINGKSAIFSDAEIQTLYFAIQDISKQLSTIRF
ncbi:MAG: DUF5053 domain-containing protein [Candidatus Azobacteroides sp.]|nr:DUF5053 domain-containing protein [Candidatus Azobacteroides sp.]